MASKVVGLTKDVGFQVGVRKTFPVSTTDAWDFLFSQKGISLWLGAVDLEKLDTKDTFHTREGIQGMIKTLKPYSHIRLAWKPRHWTNTSTLQVRVIPNKSRATISFHQEYLSDENQRNEMKAHWKGILDQISSEL